MKITEFLVPGAGLIATKTTGALHKEPSLPGLEHAFDGSSSRADLDYQVSSSRKHVKTKSVG